VCKFVLLCMLFLYCVVPSCAKKHGLILVTKLQRKDAVRVANFLVPKTTFQTKKEVRYICVFRGNFSLSEYENLKFGQGALSCIDKESTRKRNVLLKFE